MKKHSIDVVAKIELSDQDIDDLMVTALEGGINYWVRDIENIVPDGVEFEYRSELIAKGGSLKITDDEMGDTNVLNLENFMEGVREVCRIRGFYNGQELMDNHDAEIADMIIQIALYKEIMFG